MIHADLKLQWVKCSFIVCCSEIVICNNKIVEHSIQSIEEHYFYQFNWENNKKPGFRIS